MIIEKGNIYHLRMPAFYRMVNLGYVDRRQPNRFICVVANNTIPLLVQECYAHTVNLESSDSVLTRNAMVFSSDARNMLGEIPIVDINKHYKQFASHIAL